MADVAQIPRIVRQNMGREASARIPTLNRAVLARGQSAGHASAGHIPRSGEARGGGLGSAFGAGGAGGEDPVLSGGFQAFQPGHIGPIALGGTSLTNLGKEQKAAHDRIQGFAQQYQSALQSGATAQEAFRQAAKASPQALTDLMMHPTALKSMQALGEVLSPTGQGHTFSPVTGQGQQIEYDEAGRAVGANDVPGFRGAPQKPGPLVKTAGGYERIGADGTATPVLDAQGNPVKPPPSGTAAKQPPLAQSDIAGLPPQATADVPKTTFNRQNFGTLSATPEVMAALGRISNAAQAMGPIKGPLASLSGQYFGLNGQGAQFKADLDLIHSQAQRMAGSGYAAATKNFMEGIGSASDAPSFLRLQSAQMQTALRNEGQSLADEETASHQGKLPPALAHQLIGQGIVPNGYQNQQTLDQMPAGEAALWKSRFFPTALSPTDKNQLFTDAANGKFGPPGQGNQNPDFKAILGVHQAYKTQQQSRSAQQTASQAATAVQPSANPPAQQAPGVGGQPAEVAEAGAQQPQPGTQPGQQQPGQGPAQPPAGQQGNGQEAQQGQGQGTSPQMETGAGVLMPPQAVPGQPAQGVPATGGATPMPPANPLPAAPATSQMLTPQGSVPTPAVQAPLAATAPGGGVPMSIGSAQVQAHQNAVAEQAQEEQENGGQPVAPPGAEALALTPGM